MSKEIGVVMLGIFVAVLPFLGFPQSWRAVLFVIAGLAIVLLGLLLRADHVRREAAYDLRGADVRPDGRNGGRSQAVPDKIAADVSAPVRNENLVQ